MSKSILVTGATGNVGVQVIKQLSAGGSPVKAAVMNPQRTHGLPTDVPIVPFDFGNPDTFPAAFANVHKLFLIRPPQLTNVKKYFQPLLNYAKTIDL